MSKIGCSEYPRKVQPQRAMLKHALSNWKFTPSTCPYVATSVKYNFNLRYQHIEREMYLLEPICD